jgi:hypothetical protein
MTTFEIINLILLLLVILFIVLFSVRWEARLRHMIEFLCSHRWPRFDFWSSSVREAKMFVEDWEERTHVRLSPYAKELILLPIMEADERGNAVSPVKLHDTLKTIFTTMAEEDRNVRERHQASCQSLITAFHRRFCRIPPFCSGEDEERYR